MAQQDFTLEIDGSAATHTGSWHDGDRFMVLPEGEHRAEYAVARISLTTPPSASALHPEDAPTAHPAPPYAPATVAEVEARATRLAGRGAPHPALHLDDADGTARCTLHPEARPGHFTVRDTAGARLCTLHHERPPGPHRQRWRIDTLDGRPELVGHQGTLPGWCWFVLLSPLWALCFLLSLVVGVLTLSDGLGLNVWDPPKRTVWRRPGGPRALIYRPQRGGYRHAEEHLDPRIALTQAAVHHLATLRT